MSGKTGEDVGTAKRMAFGALALLGIGVMFVVGLDMMVNRNAAGGSGGFPVYAVGFFLGAWATGTTTYLVNYLGQKTYGAPAISFKFPRN